MDRFNRSKPSDEKPSAPREERDDKPKGGRGGGRGAKRASPWDKVDPKAGGGRSPMPHVGEYVFKLIGLEYGENEESIKAHVEILELDKKGEENHRAGDTVAIINKIVGGKGGVAGRMGWSRVMALVMAFAGYETNESDAFTAFDQDGLLLYDALDGETNPPTIIGRVASCRVTKGNDILDEQNNVKDFYRDYRWSVVDDKDEAQEVPRPDKQ